MLGALSGESGVTEAAESIGISLSRYYQLETRALQGMISALEPRPKGRRWTPEEKLGQMEKELKSIISGAYRTAEEIRGEADAEATRIYGDAYGQDPAFYAFFKTLETYKGAAYKNAFVILGTDSDYYRFLKTIPK